jgi:hypothetical protein
MIMGNEKALAQNMMVAKIEPMADPTPKNNPSSLQLGLAWAG